MCDLICAAEKLIKSGNKSHNEVRILKKIQGFYCGSLFIQFLAAFMITNHLID